MIGMSGFAILVLLLDMFMYLESWEISPIVISLELAWFVVFPMVLYIRWPSTFTVMMGLVCIFMAVGILIVEPNIQPHFTKEIVVVTVLGAIAMILIAWAGVWYTSSIEDDDLFDYEVVEVRVIEA